MLEAKDRVGGVIWTDRFDGFTLEGGPDSFITNKPWGLDLCRRLGLADQLVETDASKRRSFVVRNGRLAPVPEGFVLMAPNRLLPIMTTPILSLRGKLRLLMDLVIPRRSDEAEESLGSFVRRRFGREALDRLVQPLVAGIYTADPYDLSLNATFPQFPAMERRARQRDSRSASRGARARAAASREAGLGRAVRPVCHAGRRHGHAAEAPGAPLCPPGTVHTGTAVRRISRNEPVSPWLVELLDGPPLEADAVVVATEAHAAARFLDAQDPALRLAAPRDSVCVVAHRQHRLPPRPDQPSAGRLRRRRSRDRRAIDPGGLVPEREVPQPGPGGNRPAASLHRRHYPAGTARARRCRRDGPRPAGARRPDRRLGRADLHANHAGIRGRCPSTTSGTSTASPPSAATSPSTHVFTWPASRMTASESRTAFTAAENTADSLIDALANPAASAA